MKTLNNYDGGPAFPTEDYTVGNPGMSLRDYFATAALQAIIARNEPGMRVDVSIAYEYADEMLQERIVTKGKGE